MIAIFFYDYIDGIPKESHAKRRRRCDAIAPMLFKRACKLNSRVALRSPRPHTRAFDQGHDLGFVKEHDVTVDLVPREHSSIRPAENGAAADAESLSNSLSLGEGSNRSIRNRNSLTRIRFGRVHDARQFARDIALRNGLHLLNSP